MQIVLVGKNKENVAGMECSESKEIIAQDYLYGILEELNTCCKYFD